MERKTEKQPTNETTKKKVSRRGFLELVAYAAAGAVFGGFIPNENSQANSIECDDTATPTETAVPPTATDTETAVPPTATDTKTVIPPTATDTKTATPTATDTETAVPPTATDTKTAVPPTATDTGTVIPPTATDTKTVIPPTATDTKTAVPPTGTATIFPPTRTKQVNPPSGVEGVVSIPNNTKGLNPRGAAIGAMVGVTLGLIKELLRPSKTTPVASKPQDEEPPKWN